MSTLHEDRLFEPDSTTRSIARGLYESVQDLPLICPHGHLDAKLFSENRPFASPTHLILIPDPYVYRMLYSQGISLESLGIPTIDGTDVERSPQRIWQTFADNFYLYAGTPTGIWLDYEFKHVFGIEKKLTSETAQEIYNEIDEKLHSPEYLPRELFKRFNIEILATTNTIYDSLEDFEELKSSGWDGRIIPSFRPDSVTNLMTPYWCDEIKKLEAASGIEITNYYEFIEAVENRRAHFKAMGATATDHAVLQPFTHRLTTTEADSIFQDALLGKITQRNADLFSAHMLMEMAHMSTEDGLAMQIHAGSFRNHNEALFTRFGYEKGADIPVRTDYTENLQELLNTFGNNTDLTLILFTLDETAYARELAPLAGHYPALKLGPAWWFHDSIEGMRRYREQITESAGFYNTVGFNDDTRSLTAIPARHDMARRMDANFLANRVARHIIDKDDARRVMKALTHDLAKTAYKL